MALHIGTCGFSYRDWIGPFYPNGIKSLEMLPYYAERFSAVEINSTYYAIPAPKLFESMDKRTPQQFRFTVKAPGSITHVPAAETPAAAEAQAFRECLQPLIGSGKLAAVLAQFPNSFRPGDEAWERLGQLRSFWPDLPLIAEFRHRDWQADATLRGLRELGIGWCNVDEPRFRSLMRPGAEVTSDIGYIRFHGRNYDRWWKQQREAHERYDYAYPPQELTEWIPRIAEVSEQTKESFVFFNNHRNGKAAVNARQLSEMLDAGDADR
ncbi:MAG: DUF72 domain-containing protein [Candidatus Eremiobacter antarcticus]|nr:DUF72 domain-containing protein [Candidatus Eremiobacteraeota bacterium]MBC5808694.1 DUF72 domain-containing protein [Candidatus Eremiobacteraeota bacterium]